LALFLPKRELWFSNFSRLSTISWGACFSLAQGGQILNFSVYVSRLQKSEYQYKSPNCLCAYL